MARKAEYIEGTQARENFERGMRALFQVPKKKVETRIRRQQNRKATARKAKKHGNGKV